ncbi:efflux RND transporter periplasmic adaptor subunit [Algihabitans albus]|uniref:efflux RND transporter periplasmic adaptor subunit n=1 Tax=Algihabitans albus TaxID=2164067 RepID=UPI000E5CF52C|nr:efflux RND transporter periplasmic adaptor subunit [Algihabitans albus]
MNVNFTIRALKTRTCSAAIATFWLALAGPAAAADPVRVSTATVEAQPVVEEVSLVGTVVAPRSASVSTEIAGRVAEVAIELGDRIQTGAPLVRLDDMLERLSLARFEAAERADIARLEEVRRRLADARQLVSRQSMPVNEVERRESAVAEAEAMLAEERAEIAQRRERIARHVVRSPFAGTVVARMVEAGEWVEPGDTVVDLVATDQLVVDLAVPQRHFPRISLETPVTLRFAALPGTSVKARVLARVPRSDPMARTFRLRVEPVDSMLEIAPGMSADATLQLITGGEAAVVPRDAITRYPDGRVTVWTVVESEVGPVAEEREVTLGAATHDGAIYATEGLVAGVRIVTRGNEDLAAGRVVEIVETAGGEG